MLTQTVVDADDPAFEHPTKPIGSAFSADGSRTSDGGGTAGAWSRRPGAGIGASCRRPSRCGIVEARAIKVLLDAGFVVVAAGGGGIPVVEEAPGVYRGVEAVIDKDLASALPGCQPRACHCW